MSDPKEAKLGETNLEGDCNLSIDWLSKVRMFYNTKLEKELLM